LQLHIVSTADLGTTVSTRRLPVGSHCGDGEMSDLGSFVMMWLAV